MLKKKGKFISFEGGEGSGKSTQAKLLQEYLDSCAIPTILTREIGGTEIAETLRELVLHNKLAAKSELLLIMAARYDHLQKLIIPALQRGQWVICDRFIDSTACYQAGDNLTMEEIYELHINLMKYSNNINNKIEPALFPDITFLIDVTPDIALSRAIKRGDVNKFEKRKLIFHQNIYQRFKQTPNLYQDRIIKIEANDKSIKELQEIIIAKMQNFLL